MFFRSKRVEALFSDVGVLISITANESAKILSRANIFKLDKSDIISFNKLRERFSVVYLNSIDSIQRINKLSGIPMHTVWKYVDTGLRSFLPEVKTNNYIIDKYAREYEITWESYASVLRDLDKYARTQGGTVKTIFDIDTLNGPILKNEWINKIMPVLTIHEPNGYNCGFVFYTDKVEISTILDSIYDNIYMPLYLEIKNKYMSFK